MRPPWECRYPAFCTSHIFSPPIFHELSHRLQVSKVILFSDCKYASSWSLWRVKTVTWWASLVHVRLQLSGKSKLHTKEAISASVRALVHPEPSKTCSELRVISVCRPPNITTCNCSYCVSVNFHLIYLASANKGWSMVVTGICPGLRWVIACLWTFISCLMTSCTLYIELSLSGCDYSMYYWTSSRNTERIIEECCPQTPSEHVYIAKTIWCKDQHLLPDDSTHTYMRCLQNEVL